MYIVTNYQRLLIVFIFLIQADLSAFVQHSICQNNGNYTSNSAYSVNLNTLLSSLSANVDSNGFYNASVGEGIDRANAMVLCRGDVQLNTCRECIQNATAELLKNCTNQKQAIRYDELCMLRYSDVTMYGALATDSPWCWWYIHNAKSPDQFKEDLRRLIDNLRDQAASGGSLRKVAAGNATGPDFQTIFALVQCTPDLSPQDCTSCLIDAATDIPECCDRKKGGSVLEPSCNLRFEISPFFNETRLQELESVPVSVPVTVIEPPLQSSPGKDDGSTTRTIIIIVVSIVVCLLLVVSTIILLRKRKTQKPMENPEPHIQRRCSFSLGEPVDEVSTAESLQYAFSTIKAATNDFSDDNKLGQGGFGAVYKGELPNGQEIACKRLSKDSGQGDQEFKNEVLLLAKLQHRNLVRLLGFALEGMERLLIYEFVQNASLDLFIFDPIKHSYLDWDRRYMIIVSIARGILYLHEDSRLRIIHRDLKASNILLDKEMNPKIADFGMARLFGQDETQGNTSRVVGTPGYMSPEYLIHGQFSIKSDVFSFGVLVLEIISGRKNIGFGSGENVEGLLSSVWKNWREGTAKFVVDPFLMSGSRPSDSIRDIQRCIHIGLLCVQENAVDRPTIASVVLMLGSFSMTLAVPSEPAFYFPSRYGSDVSVLQEHNSRDPKYNNPSMLANQSDHSSQNDALITQLYPR